MSLNARVLQKESEFADKAKYDYFRDRRVILLNSFFSIQEWNKISTLKKKKKEWNKQTSPTILWAGLLLFPLSHPRTLVGQTTDKEASSGNNWWSVSNTGQGKR